MHWEKDDIDKTYWTNLSYAMTGATFLFVIVLHLCRSFKKVSMGLYKGPPTFPRKLYETNQKYGFSHVLDKKAKN